MTRVPTTTIVSSVTDYTDNIASPRYIRVVERLQNFKIFKKVRSSNLRDFRHGVSSSRVKSACQNTDPHRPWNGCFGRFSSLIKSIFFLLGHSIPVMTHTIFKYTCNIPQLHSERCLTDFSLLSRSEIFHPGSLLTPLSPQNSLHTCAGNVSVYF